MSRVTSIEPLFVEAFPTPPETGLLYVSVTYSTATHLCCCGCGREVVTPLSPAQWRLTFDGAVSLHPSIGNWGLPCRSHYVIERGRIRWARWFSDKDIRVNRALDERTLDRYHAEKERGVTRFLRRSSRRKAS